jgi:tRNA threonylcarbamoyladenosine biosynthesis protein TsaB
VIAVKPRLLLWDTSHQPGVVAVGDGECLRAVLRLDEARRHARDLAPAIGNLLAGQGWQPRDVEAIVVGRGPGSYTGLRVGIMSAKAFAYATGCALLGLETFAVLAAQAPADVGRLAVLADAQQDKVYVQEFEQGLPVSTLRVAAFAEWSATTTSRGATGPGLRKWLPYLPATVKPLDASFWDPRPESLLRLGLARYQRGARDDVWNMEPIYLRPSAAEEKWISRSVNG